MSYLIALYVYYHGNNLSLFGITKGARDEDLRNEGLKRPDEIDPTLVDPTLINAVKRQQQQEREMYRFRDEMIRATRESQEQSYRLHKAGLVQKDQFEFMDEDRMDDYEGIGEVDLNIF